MAGYTGLRFAGDLRVQTDPELRFTKDGDPMLRFRASERVYDKQMGEGASNWFGVTVFGQQAENLAEVLSKGDLVVAAGRVGAWLRKPDDAEYAEVGGLDITADFVAPSLKFADSGSSSASGGDEDDVF